MMTMMNMMNMIRAISRHILLQSSWSRVITSFLFRDAPLCPFFLVCSQEIHLGNQFPHVEVTTLQLDEEDSSRTQDSISSCRASWFSWKQVNKPTIAAEDLPRNAKRLYSASVLKVVAINYNVVSFDQLQDFFLCVDSSGRCWRMANFNHPA